ncbi:MAG: hypothetical protein ACPGLY_14850 [Rubripirellula sp.]
MEFKTSAFFALVRRGLGYLPHRFSAGSLGEADSAPLSFGFSWTATVLVMGVGQIDGDRARCEGTARTVEAIGFPWTANGQKRDVGRVLPMGDAIVT